MSDDTRERWDHRYRTAEAQPGRATAVLRENAHLLPPRGEALDLACGLGANALLLAEHGLETCAWDISPAAIERLLACARDRGLNLQGEARDVVRHPPAPQSFDVIVVNHFLERSLAPHLVDALRPGGLLFYQTFTRARVDDGGPRNETYRLADNELLTLFTGLRILVYREEGRTGDPGRGLRNEALLVAQKR